MTHFVLLLAVVVYLWPWLVGNVTPRVFSLGLAENFI
jgi:hypothetical protein